MKAYGNKLYNYLLAKVQCSSSKERNDDLVHGHLPWSRHRASLEVVMDHDREE